MKYEYSIHVGTVEANSLKEATKKACNELEEYAESNDGSEILANATPILTQVEESKIRTEERD